VSSTFVVALFCGDRVTVPERVSKSPKGGRTEDRQLQAGGNEGTETKKEARLHNEQ
jgi:hypothetical protein